MTIEETISDKEMFLNVLTGRIYRIHPKGDLMTFDEWQDSNSSFCLVYIRGKWYGAWSIEAKEAKLCPSQL